MTSQMYWKALDLLKRSQKNSIQWKGAGPGCNTREISDRLIVLKEELDLLKQKERELDLHHSWIKQSIRNVTDEPANSQMAYLKYNDICSCFRGDTLLAIQAPIGTKLEVPLPEETSAQKKKCSMHLMSNKGAINVMLVNQDDENSHPVVVSVPPATTDPVSVETVETAEPVPVVGSSAPTEVVTEPKKDISPEEVACEPMEVQSSESDELSGTCTRGQRQRLNNSKVTTQPKSPQKLPTTPSTQQTSPVVVTSPVTRMATRQSPRKLAQQQQQVSAAPTPAGKEIAPAATPAAAVTAKVTPPTQQSAPLRRSQRAASGNKETEASEAPVVVSQSGTTTATTDSPMQATVTQTATKVPMEAISVTSSLKDFTPDLLFESSKDMDFMDELLTAEFFSPLLRLSPPPTERDYNFNLDDSEGLYDLFDMHVLPF